MVRTETIAISFDRDTHPRVFWSREMDTVDNNKAAAAETSGTKIAIPNMTLEVIDRAIQMHAAANGAQFYPLAHMNAGIRTFCIADGSDEVHEMTIARREILKHQLGFLMHLLSLK